MIKTVFFMFTATFEEIWKLWKEWSTKEVYLIILTVLVKYCIAIIIFSIFYINIIYFDRKFSLQIIF